jgi:hypothetical protein
MIETLSNKTPSSDQEELMAHDLEITGITFEGGDLSKPRYHSLIDYGRAPAGVQFEPAIQILQSPVPELRFLFEIDPLQAAVFDADGQGTVRVTSVLNPEWTPPGLVSAQLFEGDPRRCELIWDQNRANTAFGGSKRLAPLRLHALSTDGHELSALEKVEGGVYLAILNQVEEPFPDRVQKDRGEPIPSTIKILGFDAAGGRPVYDLFQPGVLEQLVTSLTLEPAFRVREGQMSSFSMALDLPEALQSIRFEVEPQKTEVRVFGFEPESRPFQLERAMAGPFGGLPDRMCHLDWVQETGRQLCATSNVAQARRSYCTHGQAASFELRATHEGIRSEHLFLAGEGHRVPRFDPTVIQPPSCTSSGICITP